MFLYNQKNKALIKLLPCPGDTFTYRNKTL